MLDIKGKELDVDDQILYATTHGTLQVGRIISMDDGVMKVIGTGNKRELSIKDSAKQVLLFSKEHYKRLKKSHA